MFPRSHREHEGNAVKWRNRPPSKNVIDLRGKNPDPQNQRKTGAISVLVGTVSVGVAWFWDWFWSWFQ